MSDALAAIRSSIDRLTAVVAPLDDDAVTGAAYPTEWSIADVVSHLGSGAVIFDRAITDSLAGTEVPDGFARSVWDEWDAKSPRAKVDDGLAALDAFATRLAAFDDDERARVRIAMGPMELPFDTFVGLRANEQVVHEWDVAVALDPSATLPDDGTAVVLAGLPMVAGFAGRPTGDPRTYGVATTGPDATFAVAIGADSVVLDPGADLGEPDLVLPAEAFVRLVYGRLDPDHTPAGTTGDDALARLRATFPGF